MKKKIIDKLYNTNDIQVWDHCHMTDEYKCWF